LARVGDLGHPAPVGGHERYRGDVHRASARAGKMTAHDSRGNVQFPGAKAFSVRKNPAAIAGATAKLAHRMAHRLDTGASGLDSRSASSAATNGRKFAIRRSASADSHNSA